MYPSKHCQFVFGLWTSYVRRMLDKLISVEKDMTTLSKEVEQAYQTGVVDGFDKRPWA